MTTPTTLLPSTVLDSAADLVDLRGLQKDDWIQPAPSSVDAGFDAYDETTCPVCLLAAINIAAGRHHTEPLSGVTLDAAEAVAAFLGLDHLLADADDVHEKFVEVLGNGWNDHPFRTKEQVVNTLRQAARQEREAGR